ncbi:MAG: hypothetical protein QM790_20120 [Nibricoccus sp.]
MRNARTHGEGLPTQRHHLERLEIGQWNHPHVSMADQPRLIDSTLRFLNKTGIDSVQVNILTPLPGTPLFDDIRDTGRMTDLDWSNYDFRHVVFQPAKMSAEELQARADWLYAQFYRLDRVLWRFAKSLFVTSPVAAILGLRLGLTYRCDNKRAKIVGWNPARQHKAVTKLVPANVTA